MEIESTHITIGSRSLPLVAGTFASLRPLARNFGRTNPRLEPGEHKTRLAEGGALVQACA